MVHICKPKGWPKCNIHMTCGWFLFAGSWLLRVSFWSSGLQHEAQLSGWKFFFPPRALKVWSFWSNPRWFADAPGIFWPWHQHHHPPGARTLANACERAGADVSLTHLRNWLPSVDCETPTGSSWIKIDHEMCLTNRTKKNRKKLRPPMIWRNLKELDSTSLHWGALFLIRIESFASWFCQRIRPFASVAGVFCGQRTGLAPRKKKAGLC